MSKIIDVNQQKKSATFQKILWKLKLVLIKIDHMNFLLSWKAEKEQMVDISGIQISQDSI